MEGGEVEILRSDRIAPLIYQAVVDDILSGGEHLLAVDVGNHGCGRSSHLLPS